MRTGSKHNEEGILGRHIVAVGYRWIAEERDFGGFIQFCIQLCKSSIDAYLARPSSRFKRCSELRKAAHRFSALSVNLVLPTLWLEVLPVSRSRNVE